MKNKEIALRVGTTEQVVKNYLRKVYDKLGVADRLELALFCLHNRVLDSAAKVPAGSRGRHPETAALRNSRLPPLKPLQNLPNRQPRCKSQIGRDT